MKILIAYKDSSYGDIVLQDLHYAGLPACANAVVTTLAEPETALNSDPAARLTGWPSRRLVKARDAARAACEQIQTAFPAWTVTSDVRFAAPFTALNETALRWQPDLLIIGAHGQTKAQSSGLGRVAQQLLAAVRCPVRVARGHVRLPKRPLRLALRLADSPDSVALVKAVAARNWPLHTQARLLISLGRVRSRWQQLASKLGAKSARAQKLVQHAAPLLQAAGIQLSSDIHIGHTALDTLHTASAWEADCIFISAKNGQFFERVSGGNVAEKVAARATCSVEVVRS